MGLQYASKRIVVRHEERLFVAEYWHEKDIPFVVVSELNSNRKETGYYTFTEIDEGIIDQAVNQYITEFK